jgi:predicted phage terminase large subunit-like protein
LRAELKELLQGLDPTDLEWLGAFKEEVLSLADAEEKALCEHSLAEFVKAAWKVLLPGRRMDWGWHLDGLCRALEAFQARKFRRLVVNVPPRSMKSLIVNVFYPLWVWIRDEEATFGGAGHQFLTISHNQKLAVRDAANTRTILKSPWFQKHWGDRVQIVQGQDEKIRYSLTGGGHRNIGSMDSNITGENADTVIVDDPHSAKGAESDADREAATFKYENEISTRTNDRRWSGFILIMQRLHQLDMTGQWIQMYGLYHPTDNPAGVMHLVFPMEYELDDPGRTPVNPAGQWGYEDPRTVAGEVLWPVRVPKEEVLADILAHSPSNSDGKREIDRDTPYYNGQLQQRPSPKGGGVFKKTWWRKWKKDRPPVCDHVFASWDTAFSESDARKNAFSACTIWGIFSPPRAAPGEFHLFLLGAWYGQVGYPDLKAKAVWVQSTDGFNVDAHFIEKKASGISLIQDLKLSTHKEKGLRIRSIVPDKDKLTRAYAATGTFHDGMVWYPDTKWAHDIIDKIATYPKGAPPCADLVDTLSQAIVYLRRGFWVSHPDDRDTPAPPPKRIGYAEDKPRTTTYHGR